ncbi:MAG: fatty acid desaturase family protein [Bacteroidia bacterium]
MTVKDVLNKDEIGMLLQKSDAKAALEFLHTWIWITGTFIVISLFPNPVTIILGVFIIGGKQLACAILMHDAAHNALFKSKKLNTFMGQWFAAYVIWQDMERYRPYHIKHHVTTGSTEDPDITLTKGYPTTIISFVRKVSRDLIGASGIKGHIAVLLMHFGYLKYQLGGAIEKINLKGQSKMAIAATAIKNMAGPVIANLILFGICLLFGKPWLYWIWIISLLTTYNFSLRIRSIAEHSCVPDSNNPLKNTRTVYAKWWEKILFAPHHVNYHVEHHLLMTVPSYNLPKMHQLIKARGYYDEGLLEQNYWRIVNLATAKPA